MGYECVDLNYLSQNRVLNRDLVKNCNELSSP